MMTQTRQINDNEAGGGRQPAGRIVIVNPNTSTSVTERLVAEAITVMSPGFSVSGITMDHGVPAIQTIADADAAGKGVAEKFEQAGDAAVGVVGGFVDPGLDLVRQRLPYPVVGMGEAAMLTACALGGRFSVITAGQTTAEAIEGVIRRYELSARATPVRVMSGALMDAVRDPVSVDDACIRAANDAVNVDGVRAVVLGGAMFVGVARRIAKDVPVPVIDPLRAAILQAEVLVRLDAAQNRKLGEANV